MKEILTDRRYNNIPPPPPSLFQLGLLISEQNEMVDEISNKFFYS